MIKIGKRKRQTTSYFPNPLPEGVFVRHIKTGKTGWIINGHQNRDYKYAEYSIKLTTPDGSYKATLWSMWNVEQIEETEAKPPDKPPLPTEMQSFRNVNPMQNPFRSGLFFSANFWLAPEPKKNLDI